KWQALVAELATVADDGLEVPDLASNTLAAIGARYTGLADDRAVRAAFARLVELAQSVSEGSQVTWDPLSFAREIEKALPKSGSLETRAIAQQALVDSLVRWQSASEVPSADLFPDRPRSPLQGLG